MDSPHTWTVMRSFNVYFSTTCIMNKPSNEQSSCWFMMTSSNGNIFRVTGHLCGEFTGPGEFPAQMPVTRSFDVYFDLRLNKRLSKQPWDWWFETLSRPLRRHSNAETPWRSCDVTIGPPTSQAFTNIIAYYANVRSLREWYHKLLLHPHDIADALVLFAPVYHVYTVLTRIGHVRFAFRSHCMPWC